MATKVPTPKTAVVPATLDSDELTALLTQAGMLNSSEGGGFRRMSLISGSLVTDPGQPNEETWPPTKRGPVMLVRIVKPPVYYNAHYLGPEIDDKGNKTNAVDPARIGRPDLNKRFVKKYDDAAEQAADPYSNVEVYDEVCQVAGSRGQFKGDIQLQIVPESGELTGDEPIYTLSLSTTSALDYRGSRKNPRGGTVQELNFITQLGEFALAQAQEQGLNKEETMRAILNAMTALSLGGVVAEVHILTAHAENRSWPVVAFKPYFVDMPEQTPAIEAPVAEPISDDALPF